MIVRFYLGFFLVCAILVSLPARSLEIDEKLTFRILKLSHSTDTVLTNRGIEDGVAVGDHAKWFITVGVVARAVVIKASPTRSVWSVYKKIDKSYIKEDMVLNLKITPPVKLTTDPSKVFAKTVNAGRVHDYNKIPLAENANDLDKPIELPDMTDEDRRELEAIYAKSTAQISMDDRLWEIWSQLHIGNLAVQNSADVSSINDTEGAHTYFDLSLGIEKYFEDFDTWYGPLSFYPMLHFTKHNSISIDGMSVSSTVFEWGMGFRYHFFNPPNLTGGVSLFLGMNLGLGIARETREDQQDAASDINEPTIKGKTWYFAFESGIKYYWMSGLGIRASLDWYRRREEYDPEDLTATTTVIRRRVVRGPRIAIGISYRF